MFGYDIREKCAVVERPRRGTSVCRAAAVLGCAAFVLLVFAHAPAQVQKFPAKSHPAHHQAGASKSTVTDEAGIFGPRVDYPVGIDPVFVAVKDVNKDGVNDLIVANKGDNTVSVLLGNIDPILLVGDGTFQPAVAYPTGIAPTAIAIADLNGDKKQDLVVTNYNDNTISVLLGKGRGVFRPAVSYPTGMGPNAVAVADLNRDGFMDVVVTNSLDNTVSVLLGVGDGTFLPKVDYPTALQPSRLVLADINGDSAPDLVISAFGGSMVSVLLGQNNGIFNPKTDYPTGSQPSAVAVGDFNLDGNRDIATADFGGDTVTVTLSTLFGTFNPPVSYAVGKGPSSLGVGDVNGDLGLDLVETNFLDNTGGVLLSNPDGTFRPVAIFATGNGPASLALTDLNGDNALDVVVANSVDGTVSVLLNQGGTRMTLLPSVNPATVGSPVTFTATIAPSLTTTGTPAGTISFVENSVAIGSGPVIGGVVTFTTSALTLGGHAITAVYSGDASFAPNTSLVLIEAVQNPPDFSLTLTLPSPDPVTHGQVVSATALVNSLNGFVGQVALTCTVQSSGTGSPPTCSVGPASVQPIAGGTAASTLTILTGPVASLNLPNPGRGTSPLNALWLPVSGLALIGGVAGSSRKKRRLKIALAIALFAGLVFQVACSGSSTSTSSGGTVAPGTYTVMVTGTSGFATHSAMLTLTVK